MWNLSTDAVLARGTYGEVEKSAQFLVGIAVLALAPDVLGGVVAAEEGSKKIRQFDAGAEMRDEFARRKLLNEALIDGVVECLGCTHLPAKERDGSDNFADFAVADSLFHELKVWVASGVSGLLASTDGEVRFT